MPIFSYFFHYFELLQNSEPQYLNNLRSLIQQCDSFPFSTFLYPAGADSWHRLNSSPSSSSKYINHNHCLRQDHNCDELLAEEACFLTNRRSASFSATVKHLSYTLQVHASQLPLDKGPQNACRGTILAQSATLFGIHLAHISLIILTKSYSMLFI